mmetsp:Transcript_39277/g.43925  ORF Transcript_39277/g.43925 Transcript_39277/m.43925 type:complete len:85 (+) Transcript_39277:537-791(+)
MATSSISWKGNMVQKIVGNPVPKAMTSTCANPNVCPHRPASLLIGMISIEFAIGIAVYQLGPRQKGIAVTRTKKMHQKNYLERH